MPRLRPGVLCAAALLVAMLAGCAGSPGSRPSTQEARPGASERLEGTPGRAVDLLPTVWHVHGVTGAGRSTYLLFSAGEVQVLPKKGFVFLGWSTQGDRILTQVEGWAQSLGTKHHPAVPWLTRATNFRRVDTGWVLLDGHGRRLAELRDDGPAPTSRTTVTTPSPVTRFDRERVADAVAGPGARTPSIAAAAGRWTIAGLDPAHALLTMRSSGDWRITGGCESGTGQDLGGSGRFRLLPRGFLLITAGPVAGVGCVAPVGKPPADTAALTRFLEARSLTVQNDRMTLFDRRGKAIGRLTRAPAPTASSSAGPTPSR